MCVKKASMLERCGDDALAVPAGKRRAEERETHRLADRDRLAALERPLAGERDRERRGRVGRGAEDAGTIVRLRRLEEARHRPLERVLPRLRLDPAATGDAAQREVRVERELERRLARDDVERVDPRLARARPGDDDRPDRAARESEQEGGGVLDVPALALALRERDAGGSGLHADDLAGDRALQVDVVARALEHVAAALRAVEEPRARLGRPEAPPRDEADRLSVQRSAHVFEQLEPVTLVADGADRVAVLGGRDDRAGVLERARDRLLEIDVDAAL